MDRKWICGQSGLTRLTFLVVMLSASLAVADDTEIYKTEFDSTSAGRPKVLIVFDDSGSMDTEVEGQRPAYDPDGDYEQSFPSGRIYYTTDGSVPDERVRIGNSWQDNPYWFEASKNRCASSYDNLETDGRATTDRARRWVDSTIQQGQCTLQCPDGTVYRDLPGWRNDGCYTETVVIEPTPKLVRQEDFSYFWGWRYCPSGLIEVDAPDNASGCYSVVTTSDPVGGWIYRSNDRRNNSCRNGWTYLEVDGDDACYEYKTQPEGEESTGWEFYSDRVQICEDDTVVPGTWASLSRQENAPTHVECRDDVISNNTDNGVGISAGYPQDDVANGSEYGVAIDPSVDWGGESYTFYTSHYLDWYYDDSLIEDKTRMEIAQDVVSSLIRTNTGIDFGLMEFNSNQSSTNNGARVIGRIFASLNNDERTTHRSNLISMIEGMSADGATPLCESMYEAYRYLSGSDVLWGDNRRTGDSYPPDDAQARDLLAENNGTYISPASDCAYTYVILMTDGLPTNDEGANTYIENLTGKTCSDYQYDSGQGMRKNCLPELAEYMANNDLDSDETNGKQYGITYTIGFTTDQTLLSDTAERGKGEYYTANDAQELTEAFQGALTSILSKETTFTSPAVAVDTFTRTQSRDEVFYAMFKPDDSVDWIGNIKKLKLDITDGNASLEDANGNAAIDPATGYIKDSAITFWGPAIQDGGLVEKGGVGALLASRDPATRSLYIDTGANGELEAFNTTNITADAFGLAQDADLYALFGASTFGAFSRQVAWGRGFDAYNSDENLRDEPRPWILADILHSQPLVLNYGARSGFSQDNPDLRLLVGTNNGFVHLFGASDGVEDWAFFPKELANILPLRRRDAQSSDNVYGMDLTPVAYTKDLNSDGTIDSAAGDKVWVYLGMRRGGNAYYALDVSNPDSPQFMWRIAPDVSGFGLMGQTWSEPVVTVIPGYKDNDGVNKPVLVFGGGYDTSKDSSGVAQPDSVGRGIYIVDAETGALIWSVTPAASSATNLSEPGLQHSVPGDVTVLDSNGDRLTDRIYFGDAGGHVWRVDLSGNSLPTASQDTWQINKLADFNRGSVTSDRRFFNAPDVVRVRFDGHPVDAVIIGSGDRTNPNGTSVDNRVYMIRDEAVAPYVTARPTSSECADPDTADFRCELPFVDGDLYDITADLLTTGTDEERAAALTALQSANGWRFDLLALGEKNLAKSLTINGKIYITSFTPASLVGDINVCEPQSGTGKLYIIDLYDGSRDFVPLGPIIPDTPSVHFGNDGKIRLLLPPGTPPGDSDGDGDDDCESGVCDVDENLPSPYGTYWFQEEY